MPSKVCKQCKKEKTEIDFHKNCRLPDGLSFYCKVCNRTRTKQWASDNLERNRNRAKIWAELHRDRNKDWQKNNPNAVYKKSKRWKDKNPDKVRQYDSRRRVSGSTLHFTAEDIKLLISIQQNRCSYCGISLTSGYHVDHIIPLSRGGDNSKENIAVTCPKCNLSKNNKLLWIEWIPVLAT